MKFLKIRKKKKILVNKKTKSFFNFNNLFFFKFNINCKKKLCDNKKKFFYFTNFIKNIKIIYNLLISKIRINIILLILHKINK